MRKGAKCALSKHSERERMRERAINGRMKETDKWENERECDKWENERE